MILEEAERKWCVAGEACAAVEVVKDAERRKEAERRCRSIVPISPGSVAEEEAQHTRGRGGTIHLEKASGVTGEVMVRRWL